MTNLFFGITLLFFIVIALSSFATYANNISVEVNGELLSFDVTPTIIEGRTVLPVRAIFESLGLEVGWNEKTRTVTGKNRSTVIKLTIDNKTGYINGVATTLDVPATIIEGRTLVPARFVAEATGAEVGWNGDTKTVFINKKTEQNSKNNAFEGYKVIEVDGGNLSGYRESNVVVDIGYGNRGYYAFTNKYGQLVKVTAKEIILQDDENEPVLSTGRYFRDEAKVPGTESPNLDEGHVIADSLGGVSNAYNITPQESTLNRYGDQAYMEDTIRKALKAGLDVTDFVAIITYSNNETQIPSHYKFTYKIDGREIIDEFNNINPDEVNEQMGLTDPIEESKMEQEDNLYKIDTNNNGKVTISEAKAAGFKMPITSDHWLYKYMMDSDGDGMVGE